MSLLVTYQETGAGGEVWVVGNGSHTKNFSSGQVSNHIMKMLRMMPITPTNEVSYAVLLF